MPSFSIVAFKRLFCWKKRSPRDKFLAKMSCKYQIVKCFKIETMYKL